LKEELKKSMDREHYYAMVIELVTVESEAYAKPLMDRLKELPIVPKELEMWKMRCEDFEARYVDLSQRYASASELIFELLSNNKMLLEKVNDLAGEVKNATFFITDCSKSLVFESKIREDLYTSLLYDSKNLFTAMDVQDAITKRDLRFNSEIIKRMMQDLERYKTEIKQIDEICDEFKLA
jgi:hypothetical protein